MCKSIVVNKVLLLFISMFFSTSVNSQINIYDTWRIDNVIGIRNAEEYSMVRMGENRWGNMLVLNNDWTFVSGNLPECGNDIHRNVLGHFVLIDDTHIRFSLNEPSSVRYGKNDNTESELNSDLGIFYIFKEENSIRLIKSNGILQDDKDKMLYTEMLKTFDKNWKYYNYSWISTKAKIPEEIVKDCFDSKSVALANYKIVFLKKEDYGALFLVSEKEGFHYVLYDDIKQKVSLAYPR